MTALPPTMTPRRASRWLGGASTSWSSRPDGFVFALRLFHVAKRGPHRVGFEQGAWAARIPFRSPSRKGASHRYRDTAAESPFAAGKKSTAAKRKRSAPGLLSSKGDKRPAEGGDDMDLRFGGAALMTTSVIACMASAAPAMAQTRSFDVPAQEATAGVAALARQAKIQFFAARKDTRGKRTNAVRGDMTVEQALSALLNRTGLTVRRSGDQTCRCGSEDRRCRKRTLIGGCRFWLPYR